MDIMPTGSWNLIIINCPRILVTFEFLNLFLETLTNGLIRIYKQPGFILYLITLQCVSVRLSNRSFYYVS